MKLIRTAALSLMALLAVVSGSAHAQATANFNVKVDLTPKCYINMTAAPADGTVNDATLTYVAFQTSPAQSSTAFSVKCTNSFPYSVAVSSDTGTLTGIEYFLKLVQGSTVAYATASGEGSLTAQTGSASGVTYTVGVQAAAGQAGTCTAAPCTDSASHTVTVTY